MANALQNKKKTVSEKLFPVVGIGASAGGLEAFKKLVKAIPKNSGMAYILVQHLHPDHSSALPEILQRETTINVEEISDNVRVKPDNIYVIPANKMLVANDGTLELGSRPKDKKNNLIDIFFSSLADVHQGQAVGIILSGTGADGTLGLKRIKEQGGITFVQDAESAAFDDMPQNAIKSDVVDFVLKAEDMPRRLVEIMHTFRQFDGDGKSEPQDKAEEEYYRQILSLLRLRFGADFNFYKQTTIRRRILRRLAILNQEKIRDYFEYLQQNKNEQTTLFYDLLIPVTSFFRDTHSFDYICKTAFPELVKDKSAIHPLRIWIAGCSTGEEAYSIAICLYEYLSNKTAGIKIQIFATDLSEQAIAKARSGVYSKRQLDGVSEMRLQQFFTKTDGSYQVNRIIRDMCVFATHNFLKDPPFAKIDFISCRNVLIYMEPFLQKKAFTTFHYSLNEKGYLFLGRSETAGSAPELFLPADNKERLFTRKFLPAKFMHVTSLYREEVLKDKDYGLRSNERKKDDFQKNAEEILLLKYTPPGVIVNEQYDIVQFRGSTGAYLEPSPGKASLNVLKMAREGLSFELRNALHKVKSNGETFIKKGIALSHSSQFSNNDGDGVSGQRKKSQEKKIVTIEVVPLPNSVEPHYLILFKDEEVPVFNRNPASADADKEANEIQRENTFIKQLEKDLSQAREDMRSITEEQEASNEELQSANEELLSGSEELQSLNEELETSKEELQSTNEELVTVNQELFDRNEQLNKARLYAEGIITTIHEPMIVLNADFSIKTANDAFYENFSITEEETVGKNLFALQNNGWNIPGLKNQLLKIQETKASFLEWELTYTFPFAGERSICFNAQPIPQDNEQHLILLALDDITLRTQAEKIHSAHNMQVILESMPQITFSADAAGAFTYLNNYFIDYAGMPAKKALKSGWLAIIHPDQYREALKAWKHSIKTLENFNMEFRLKRKSDGMYCWHVCKATAIINDDGTVTSWVGTATDIDEQKAKEKEKDEFISTASHELKTPITTAKAFVQMLEHTMQKNNSDDIIYARKASIAIEKLNSLVAELLDVTKIQHGKLGLTISSFNFNDMLKEAIESVQVTTSDHKIISRGEIKKEVKGDAERLKQVVINLLTNAIKYSPAGENVIVNTVQENGTLKVGVTDNGMGIKRKNLNKVFDRYFREEGQTGHLPGLGIGLSISKEIITRHKGRIWAESEPGIGSIFYFTIPL